MGEEKGIMQENVNNCLKISQEESDKLKKELEVAKKTIDELKK
jgi:hypothetical protein